MKKNVLLMLLMEFCLVSCGGSQVSSSISSTSKIPSSTPINTSSTSSSYNESSIKESLSSNSKSEGGNSMSNATSSSSIAKNELNDGYVVYINLDGFGRYYYDEAVSKGLVPTLESIKDEGVVFNNLRTLSPSITNPCQAMIISGASSNKTRNVYRYYDKTNNIVVQQGRENDADTLYDSVIRNKVKSATIHHFPAESVFSTTNTSALYIKTPFGEVSNYNSRFDQAIKLVKGEQFKNDSTYMKVNEIPKFISIYCDDLDALGHNESAYDTFSLATSETERVNNVVTRLNQIDKKLGEFIQACKDAGIYDKTTFFLTTDHGMQGFGAETKLGTYTSKYSKTKWPELKTKLASINKNYKFEYVAQNKSPSSSATVIGVGSGLQMPLTFKGITLNETQLQDIKKSLKEEYYIAEVYTRAELIKAGFWNGANVDLLVIPSERYHFHGRDNSNNYYAVRGQHDTMSEHANNIYGAIWGNHVKNIGESDLSCENISFGSTMAKYLGVDLLSSNAPVLEEIIEY